MLYYYTDALMTVVMSSVARSLHAV